MQLCPWHRLDEHTERYSYVCIYCIRMYIPVHSNAVSAIPIVSALRTGGLLLRSVFTILVVGMSVTPIKWVSAEQKDVSMHLTNSRAKLISQRQIANQISTSDCTSNLGGFTHKVSVFGIISRRTFLLSYRAIKSILKFLQRFLLRWLFKSKAGMVINNIK